MKDSNKFLENLNQKPDLIIRLNTNPIHNFCPLCGVQVNPNIGAELFLAESDNIVCLDCGMLHAPILATLVNFADFSRLFHESGEPLGKRLETYFHLSKFLIESENKFGDKWQSELTTINSYQNFGGI